MKKLYVYLTALLGFSYLFLTNPSHAKDSLFIKQDKFDSWMVSKYYNDVYLSNIKGSSPVEIKINLRGYSLELIATIDISEKIDPTIELDVGNFITHLKQIDKTNSYIVRFEPVTVVQFIDALKTNKNIILYLNDQNTIKVPLNGINKALDEMDDFANNHYILMPIPFSQKIDIYTSMPIPDIVSFELSPIFRQQAYFNDLCKDKDGTEKKDACDQRTNLLNILKDNNICEFEQNQPAQSANVKASTSYHWVYCNMIK